MVQTSSGGGSEENFALPRGDLGIDKSPSADAEGTPDLTSKSIKVWALLNRGDNVFSSSAR